MLVEHQGRRPAVDASAWIAPTAVVCGEVVVGPRCQIGFGAVLVAEGGPISLGRGQLLGQSCFQVGHLALQAIALRLERAVSGVRRADLRIQFAEHILIESTLPFARTQ